MFERLRTRVLRLMRVPHDPAPPLGAPDSIKVFRAGDNFYQLKLITWAIGQFGALIGLGFALFASYMLITGIQAGQAVLASTPRAPAAVTAPAVVSPPNAPVDSNSPAPPTKARKRSPVNNAVRAMGRQTATVVVVLIEIIEIGGVIFFLAQFFVTFAMVRLSFELHWYIVTDRSLRIRTGILRLQETTMSFANIQQVTVTQGPLQRLLGLADVQVQSAGGGGGGGSAHQAGADTSLHTGVFAGVSNAVEIRDLILERLRRFRATGLGDPDDAKQHMAGVTVNAPPASTLDAARELLAEATALRQKIGTRSSF